MSYSNFPYPKPPHISAAFYFDISSPTKAFSNVGECIMAAGGRPTGHLTIIRTNSFPHFSMISDMASKLELIKLNIRKKTDLEKWKFWLYAQDSAVHVLSVAFETPLAGTVILAFEPIPDEAKVDTLHPIGVTISGVLLSMPAWVSLNKREKTQATKAARFLMSVFHSICDSFDPLYGSITVEKSLPTPFEIITEMVQVGTVIFCSDRLEVFDPGFQRDLIEIFSGGFSERWKSGIFVSGWSYFNSEGLTFQDPFEVTTHATRRFVKALKMQIR